jgi:ubiquitin-conjugating enzyme (huntingtin interacting protein 2)
MLVNNPKEFERIAREWSVKYANAPKKDIAETSGGAPGESDKQKAKRNKEEEHRLMMEA